MRILLARYLRSVMDAVVAFGHIWVHIPPVTEPGGVPVAGPPAGHPERLCPEIPLSEAEMAWRRQLLEPSGADPRPREK
ncbi:hypothetical protein OG782_35015 [Streptomyces sp. NBC_00876]|uniref:DUF6059 family protein n=1 Tax=Streptomyces sp. NBC_00876 TaxID=2975853 RepID=UPI00386CBBC4|nr:hypothetical protein OG782_35015 [Streptomyces sp. NBC_00876]